MRLANREIKEKCIENQILILLNKFPKVTAWKYENIGVWDQKLGVFRRRTTNFKPKGFPDIFGILQTEPWPRFFTIEVKSRLGKLTPQQERMLGELQQKGVITLIARSIEDVESHPDIAPFLKY
jgi:VRR-NUC domain